MNLSSILEVRQLTKSYPNGDGSLTVLKDITFILEAGSSCAIVGPSGSGKTTLLGLCAGLDQPTSGMVRLAGVDLGALDEDGRARVRNESVGFVFRELLLNAIEWGGQLDPNRKVRIACLRARRMLLYRIADPGPGFSFKGLRHAAVGHPEGSPLDHMSHREDQGLRPGGFGIMIAQAKVDELIYNEAQNEVVFVKYLD